MTRQLWEQDIDDYDDYEVSNQNVASDHAHVDQQIGAIYGDAAFHRHESVYHINQADPPARRYRVALNHLDGGIPRLAEETLGELLREGHTTSEGSYYYVLAVLSDRSLSEITGPVFHRIVAAYRTCSQLPPDQWRDAMEVVWQLLWCMHQQADASLDAGRLQEAQRRFTALPADRQTEITRHLAMILSGMTQSRLEATDARRVVQERMEHDRIKRAWKFFQPVPASPRQVVVQPPKPTLQHQLRLGGGGLVFGAGLLVALVVAAQVAAVLEAVVALLLLGAGGYLALRYGVEREVLRIRLRRKGLEYERVGQPPPVSPGHWVPTAFVEEIHSIVDRRFKEARPHIRGDWTGDTAGVRAYLKLRFVDLYGNAQVPAQALSWLIKWHVDQIAVAWRSGLLFGYRQALVVPQRMAALFVLGIWVAVAGLVTLFVVGAGAAALLTGPGGFVLAKAGISVLALRRADRIAQREASQLYEEELRAFHDWQATLSDRPSDAEMARWLAMDKAYLKAAVLQRLQLSDHDLVAHLVITEGARGAMRARVLHGPPRYSSYVVLIFLLTGSGVRQVTVDLDFLQGKAHNERRNAFRYEALASASVRETGVRVANHQGVQQPDEHDAPLQNERLRSRSFRLTLVSGEKLSVVTESFRNLSDDELEDADELLKLALRTSGIEGALHVLEAVAAEGPNWIGHERERRRRWSQDWHNSVNNHNSLVTAAALR